MDNGVNGEQEMRETQRAALKKIRDTFQMNYPHYTPPRDAGDLMWGAWVGANLRLHGVEGFRARFPKQAALLERPGSFGEPMTADLVAKLHALAYGEA
jgi:hypothetical protein